MGGVGCGVMGMGMSYVGWEFWKRDEVMWDGCMYDGLL